MCPKVIADRQTNIVKCPNNYSKLLECLGCYVPLLLTPVEGWGPSGPSWDPYIITMAKIAKIATMPSILIKLT